MKGVLQPDHIPLNQVTLTMLGLPTLTFTSITGLEEELQTVDLPDRTRATGGNTNPTEAVVRHPMHHVIEEVALEAWFQEGQGPVVSPLYKKPGFISFKSGTGSVNRVYALVGVFISRRKLPDSEMANEGEQAESEWTLSIDDILPPA